MIRESNIPDRVKWKSIAIARGNDQNTFRILVASDLFFLVL